MMQMAVINAMQFNEMNGIPVSAGKKKYLKTHKTIYLENNTSVNDHEQT
jgi:hypothetical protein